MASFNCLRQKKQALKLVKHAKNDIQYSGMKRTEKLWLNYPVCYPNMISLKE